MEFLELKQGNMTVAEYATKFKELVKYFPHYLGRNGESSKCVKRFVAGSGSKPTTFSTQIICFRCGKPGHISSNFIDKDRICFNYRQKGHIQRDCPYPKKEQIGGGLNDQTECPKATGKVFTLNSVETSKSQDLIQGKYFISGIPSNNYRINSKQIKLGNSIVQD